ncbi:DNA-binding protein [Betaproteobacteria bacterium]|nr:DNA-binding protein [Betaproteobacteria bacterium]GHT98033.1 DNA-binding protein [Betaproteobacteria bacterium]GHU24350.1 DNA-binding protein [Betaproteobacteria bacterium]GHU31523.1 DNA-binding protein [Betaproteobacteria bacterium]
MKVVIDTNIIIRMLINPQNEADREQRYIAENLLQRFDEVIIPTHVFCEVTWILDRHKYKPNQVCHVFKAFLESDKFVCKEEEIEAGMLMLEQGGDFADGVNEYTGRVMTRGLSVFASFDKKAVKLLSERGIPAMIPQL